MTPSEIRNEIYKYITSSVLPMGYDMKVWQKHQKELSKLLKKFGTETEPKVIIKKEIIYKEKRTPKNEDNYWSL